MDAMRTRASATLSALALSALVGLGLAGCSTSSDGSRPSTPAPAETIAASAVPSAVPADPAAPVPAGEWALVFDNSIQRGQSYAYRVASVVKGKAGEFADAQTQSGSTNATLKDAVPYFIALQFAAMSGDEVGAQAVSGFSVTDPGVSTLSVPEDLRRCDPAETDAIPGGLGEVQVRCIVALGTDDAAPTRLGIRGSSSAEDTGIHEVATLALPAAR